LFSGCCSSPSFFCFVFNFLFIFISILRLRLHRRLTFSYSPFHYATPSFLHYSPAPPPYPMYSSLSSSSSSSSSLALQPFVCLGLLHDFTPQISVLCCHCQHFDVFQYRIWLGEGARCIILPSSLCVLTI
jgi:hypothetical protein